VIRARIARLMLSNVGDSKPVDGKVVVVLLCGGDNGSQRPDIDLAKRYLADYRRLIEDA
jgi:putative component of toxin-antitoxin plasmid stabilization module